MSVEQNIVTIMVSCCCINGKCSKYRREAGMFIFKARGIDPGKLFCFDTFISILSEK